MYVDHKRHPNFIYGLSWKRGARGIPGGGKIWSVRANLCFLFQLLTVTPRSNCLALVYKDEETLSFVKYVNHNVKSMEAFYDVNFVYCE